MRRRTFLASTAAAAVQPLAAGEARVQSLADALRWLEGLERAGRPAATGAWPLGTVLSHLAQSIEMSMDGYPRPRSAIFQATAGAAAFSFFKWRGRMSHGLAEPIPGAPVLPATTDWRPGAQRLSAAIRRFEAHPGALRPHFAYGVLGKADYAIAHALHIANHQDEVFA